MSSISEKLNNCQDDVPVNEPTDHEINLLGDFSLIRNASNYTETTEAAVETAEQFGGTSVIDLNDTSPGTLRDVTMDNTYGVGYRSPLQQYQGSTSPAVPPHGGRSVREFEEQMVNLRKENFNLKLRLYFIEESIPGYQQANNSAEGHETLMKQLIDTKVEMEVLRKEVQEKQEILKEAAQAMNQMEQIQKDAETKYEEMLDELRQKLQYSDMERDLEKSQQSSGELVNDLLGRSDTSGSLNTIQKMRELEGLLKQSEIKLVELQTQNLKLEELLCQRNETIGEYEEKVKELAFQNAELLESIETKEKEIVIAERSLRGLRLTNGDLKADNESLIATLRVTQENFRKEATNMKCCERQMREQQDALSKMQAQNLRAELHEYKTDLADKLCTIHEMEEKMKTNEIMYVEARQTIAELKQKLQHQQQPEMEKYQNSSSAAALLTSTKTDRSVSGRLLSDTEVCATDQIKKYETLIQQQENIIKDLKMEVKKKTVNLQNLVNKELWEKNREIERLTKMINSNNSAPVSPNKNDSMGELQQSFSDVEYCKALERNKLLQRKVDVLLQRLDNERCNEANASQLRMELLTAQEQLKRSEKWRRDCGDVCAVLTKRLEELAGFLNSLLRHKDVLDGLAADRRHAMRKAVNRSLDLSKSLNMTLSVSGISLNDDSLAQLSNLSLLLDECANEVTFNLNETSNAKPMIETLKEENTALKKELDKRRYAENKKDRRSLPLALLENQSESEAWSEPDRKVSMARIGLDASGGYKTTCSLLAKEIPSSSQHLDTESEYDRRNSGRLDSRTSKARNSMTQERVQQLEEMVAERDERILEIQCQLFDAENRLKQFDDLNKDELTTSTKGHSAEGGNITYLEQLERQMKEKIQLLNAELEHWMTEAGREEDTIKQLTEEIKNIKQQHEQEVEKVNEKHQESLANIRRELENQMLQRLNLQKKEHEDNIKHNWVAMELYNQLNQQVAALQRQCKEAQNNIECLEENERELKQTLVESELNARKLQKSIDENTLQSSKIVMERSKALHDKYELEKDVQELKQRLEQHNQERHELQQQIRKLENDLKAAGEATKSADDGVSSQSGYTSEELATQKLNNTAGKLILVDAGAATCQRLNTMKRLQNSSPDLGIESDAGRASSVELTNTQVGLLKTIEMQSNVYASGSKKVIADISDVLENNENIHPLSNTKTMAQTTETLLTTTTTTTATLNGHDCVKVEQENAELRRKLMRTQRALESTYEKLRTTNQRKEQIEKHIKSQILKTHHVLKTTRSNMESQL